MLPSGLITCSPVLGGSVSESNRPSAAQSCRALVLKTRRITGPHALPFSSRRRLAGCRRESDQHIVSVARAGAPDKIGSRPCALWAWSRVRPYGLSLFYPLVNIAQFSAAYVLLPAVALAIAALLYWRWTRELPVLKFAAAWFLLTLLPVIGEFSWVQLHDRHLYLPSFGMALMLAVLLQRAAGWARFRSEHAPAIAALVIAAVLAGISAREARFWDNGLVLCERAVAVAPANPDALSLLADTYDFSGAPDKAAATLQSALQYYPRSAKFNFALAHRYYTLRRYAAARPYLERALAIGGDNDTRSTALYELAMLEQTDGKRDAAEQHLREAIRLAPHIAGCKRALATLLRAPASATASPAAPPADRKP